MPGWLRVRVAVLDLLRIPLLLLTNYITLGLASLSLYFLIYEMGGNCRAYLIRCGEE